MYMCMVWQYVSRMRRRLAVMTKHGRRGLTRIHQRSRPFLMDTALHWTHSEDCFWSGIAEITIATLVATNIDSWTFCSKLSGLGAPIEFCLKHWSTSPSRWEWSLLKESSSTWRRCGRSPTYEYLWSVSSPWALIQPMILISSQESTTWVRHAEIQLLSCRVDGILKVRH